MQDFYLETLTRAAFSVALLSITLPYITFYCKVAGKEMNRNNSRYVYRREGKENQPQYQVSKTVTYFNKANNYHYRNNRWQPYYLQNHRSASGFGKYSRRYDQHQNFQQSHYAEYSRSRYQLKHKEQPWLSSQSTSTNSNSLLRSPTVSIDSNQTISSAVQQGNLPQDPVGNTHGKGSIRRFSL